MTIGDNGLGLAQNFNIENKSTLGMSLAKG